MAGDQLLMSHVLHIKGVASHELGTQPHGTVLDEQMRLDYKVLYMG